MEKKRKILLNIGNEILQKKLNDSLTDYSVKTLDNKDVLPYMENGLLITDGSLDNFVSEDFIEHNNSIMLLSNEDDEVSDSLKKSATIILSSFDIDTILSETGNIFDRSRNVSAYKDSVTGLYNTDTFYKQARAYINKYSGCSFSIVISDFENFRLINSVYGEDRGDDLFAFDVGAGDEEGHDSAIEDGDDGRHQGHQKGIFQWLIEVLDRVRGGEEIPPPITGDIPHFGPF